MFTKRIKTKLFVTVAVILLLLPGAAIAEELRVTPYLGYRVGGEFEDFATSNRLKLKEGDAYGLIVSWGQDATYELLLSRQETELTASQTVAPSVLFDVDVTNILFSGRNILNKEVGSFMSGVVGMTRYSPGVSGFSTETRFALGAGAGIDYRVSKALDIRLEGRAVATFLDSSGGVFCSSASGCAIFADSDVVWQVEFISGFTFKFD